MMNGRHSFYALRVRILTLTALLLTGGCAFVDHHLGESCNSHAYLRTHLLDHITTRFPSDAPVRMAIVPFSVPANLTSYNNERVGLEQQIAWKVHQHFVATGEIPIVEVFNRQDWPGKKEEFFTGNFGALALAREAGYDLVLVGYLDPPRDFESLTAYSKILDVESGVTLFYGQSGVKSRRGDFREWSATFGLSERVPSYAPTQALVEALSRCVVEAALSEEEE